MLSKNELKLYRSLKQKKMRSEHKLFLVEGIKSVEEALKSGFDIVRIFTSNPENVNHIHTSCLISNKEMSQISALKIPSDILCIVRIPPAHQINFNEIGKKLILIIDRIQDPGNLGTIIRSADWFGVDTIICSNDTADAYNPKVIQATMGSFCRTKLIYCDLNVFISDYKHKTNLPIYATVMNGKNIFKEQLQNKAAIIIGNEGSGISDSLLQNTTHQISIPKKGIAESLNASTATAIVLSEFYRRL